MTTRERVDSWRLVALGGLAGGIAEVLWVVLYSSASDVSAAVVARQVTASLWPAAAAWPAAPALGIVFHMGLAVALAALCAPLLIRAATRHAAPAAIALVAVTALAVVWAVNFFLVLPLLNPGFVDLMPYSVTLVSKMLFGLAMAAVVQQRARRAATPVRVTGRVR